MRPRPLIFTVFYFLSLFFIFNKEITYFWKPDPSIKRTVKEEFDYGKLSGFGKVQYNGLETGSQGLYIMAKGNGELQYEFNKEPQEAATVYARSYADGAVSGVNASWQVKFSGWDEYRALDYIRRFDKRDFLIDLTKAGEGHDKIYLKAAISNSNSKKMFALNWLEVKLIDAATLKNSSYEYPGVLRMDLLFLLFMLPLFLFFRKNRYLWILFFVCLAGFHLRYNNLTNMIFVNLETDPSVHFKTARDMKLFTQGGLYSGSFGEREAFFPFASKLFLGTFGYSKSHQRLVSFFLSLAVITLSYWLGKKVKSKLFGILTASFVAFNPSLIYESARGNRLEMITVFVLLLITVSFIFIKQEKPKPWLFSLLGGAIGGYLVFTFFYSIAGTMIVIFFSLLIRIKKPVLAFVYSFLSLAVILLVVMPYKINANRFHGSDVSKRLAYYNANIELSGEQRLPFDKKTRITYDLSRNKGFSFFDYLFRMHSPYTNLLYGSEGLLKALAWQGWNVDRSFMLNIASSAGLAKKIKIIFPVALLMILNLFTVFWIIYFLFSREYRVLSLSIITYLLPVSWFLGWRIFEFQRYIMHVYPLFILCALLGINVIFCNNRRKGTVCQ